MNGADITEAELCGGLGERAEGRTRRARRVVGSGGAHVVLGGEPGMDEGAEQTDHEGEVLLRGVHHSEDSFENTSHLS